MFRKIVVAIIISIIPFGISYAEDENPFLGKWSAKSFNFQVPEPCISSVNVEFRDNGILITKSGSLVVVESYTYTRDENNIYSVSLKRLSVTGSENCQGRSAAYVKENFTDIPSEYEFEGGKLKQYIMGRNNPYVMYLEKNE